MCSTMTTMATGAMMRIAVRSNVGNTSFGRPIHAASATGCEVHEAKRDRHDVADDDAHQDRDRLEEALEVAREDDGRAERDRRDEHVREVDALGRIGHREQRHLHGDRRQAEPDDDHDGADERRRQDLVEPAGADGLDDRRDDHVDHAGGHQTTQGRGDVLGLAADDGDERCDEREAGTQVARDLVAHADEIEDRADARGHEADAGIEAGEDRHENGRAEHGHQVLERQRDRPRKRQSLVGLHDALVCCHYHPPFLSQSRWDPAYLGPGLIGSSR